MIDILKGTNVRGTSMWDIDDYFLYGNYIFKLVRLL